MRFKGGERDRVKMRLEKVRQSVVTAYKKSEIQVKVPHRGIEKSVYERKYPGRIEAKGMKVIRIQAEGNRVEIY